MNYNQYVRAKSLDEAYTLYQKKNNVVLGGMLWLKMQKKNCNIAIDLCDLGLDQIEETEEACKIGAYVSLRELETNESLNRYTNGAMREALRHIVGVQFRNVAMVGASIWGRFGFSDVMTIFRSLGASVVMHDAGEISLDEFVAWPRNKRDILTHIIVPKQVGYVAYLSQRNNSTDFPVLTCAVAQRPEGYVAVIGAYPFLAKPVWDGGLVSADASGITEEMALSFGQYVAEQIPFGGNMRAGAVYRKKVAEVLVKRAMLAIKEQAAQSGKED